MIQSLSHRILSSLICIVLAGLPISCGKDNPSSDTAARIEGDYLLSDISWTGNPVDVNGDGVASNQLYAELMSLSMNADTRFTAEVLPYSPGHSEGVIGIRFPIQNSSATYDGRYPTGYMTGGTLSLSVPYEIDSDGHLSIECFDSFDVPKYEQRVEIKNIHDGKVWFDECDNLYFEASYTFYDRLTDELVSGVIKYTYTKIES